MAFGLSLAYVVLTLLSPLVLPHPLSDFHVPYILGVMSIIACIFGIGRSRLFSFPDALAVLAFTFIVFMSSFKAKGGTIALDGMGNLLPVVLVFYFLQISVNDARKMKIMAGALGAVGIFIFLNGMAAYSSGHLASPYLDPEHVGSDFIYRFRGLGVLSDPNDTALLFVATIPLLFIRWKKGAVVANVFLSLLPAGLLIAGIFFTHSRGGLLAMSAMFLFAFKDRLGPVKAGILIGCLFVVLVGLNLSGGRGMAQDDGGRVALWATALTAFRTHPILGIGMSNMYEYTDNGLTAHNSYVLAMAETGIFGYFFWMFIIVAAWQRVAWTMKAVAVKRNKDDEEPATPMTAALRARSAPAMAASARRPWAAGGLTPAMSTAGPVATLPAPAARVQLPRFPGRFEDEDIRDPEEVKREFAFMGNKLRAALVGVLLGMFFLSRTYAMTPYIVLGLIAALWSMRTRALQDEQIPVGFLYKRTALVVLASIIGLQIIIKIVGTH